MAAKYNVPWKVQVLPLWEKVSVALELDPPLSEGDWQWACRVLTHPGSGTVRREGRSREWNHQRAIRVMRALDRGKTLEEAAAKIPGLSVAQARVLQRQFLDALLELIQWYRKHHGLEFRTHLCNVSGFRTAQGRSEGTNEDSAAPSPN